jgi:tRNA (adenine-N(1)-)-methyltransferase non-catalytic subunit
LIIDRPYHLTYEVRDEQNGGLRIVPASELHADTIAEEDAAADGANGDIIIDDDGVEYVVGGEDGHLIMRSNRETVDSAATQTLTHDEIEALKRDSTDAGRALIDKLMASHTAIDKKTAYSLAKYKLLKTKKYLRQFTVLPLDVAILTRYLIEDKDPGKILDIRDELIGLIGCWANVHFMDSSPTPSGRWLMVDETGGLLVAAMAERMGILYQDESEQQAEKSETEKHQLKEDTEPALPTNNTITLIHTNTEPNLSLLKYFHYTPTSSTPNRNHPLTTHLKPISWLQLISPTSDPTYSQPPPEPSADALASWKSGKRGNYYRKKRRYLRCRSIVDETQAGGFDGLIVASNMDPEGILKSCVPLLRGGAQVVVYSPTIEPLAQLADFYSMSRRTAWITNPPAELLSLEEGGQGADPIKWQGNEGFPLNPTLLLNVGVQTSRVRKWQVLPGRTHPMMTSRGGAEGFLFTATRAVPLGGRVSARGKYGMKKRKVEVEGVVGVVVESGTDSAAPDVASKTVEGEGDWAAVETGDGGKGEAFVEEDLIAL